MTIELNGKIALVTGASRGIGEAIIKQLAASGLTVIGTSTSTRGAEGITDYLKSIDNPGFGVVMNFNEPESIDAGYELVVEQCGAPNILVNNAGIAKDNLFLRMKESDWDEVMQVNLKSVFTLTKKAVRAMLKARWGRVVNISSVVATMGNPGQANYCAAKAALEGFSRSLAQELGGRSITVNCVAPGFIATDMTESMSSDQKEAMLAHIPLNRLGCGEDIAKAVEFLISDGANYITGATIPVNGGLRM